MKAVMIVEDDQDIRESMKDFLEGEGFQVLVAENGKTALELLRSLEVAHLPQLIYLDLMMPVMDGVTFRSLQIKEPKLSAVPVVVTSAAPNAAEKLCASPVSAILRKPCDLDELLDAFRLHSKPT